MRSPVKPWEHNSNSSTTSTSRDYLIKGSERHNQGIHSYNYFWITDEIFVDYALSITRKITCKIRKTYAAIFRDSFILIHEYVINVDYAFSITRQNTV